jgi:hypothetical protein
MSAPHLDRRTFLRAGLAAGVAAAGAAVLPARAARAAVADLDFASALEAASAIQTGTVSSVELTTHMLERIARLNPKLNAIVALGADGALGRARAADEARARREWWGRFHGVPITIKDTFEVAAQPRADPRRRGGGAAQGRRRGDPRQDQRADLRL